MFSNSALKSHGFRDFRGTERADRKDRTNFTIDLKNDDKTTLRYGIVRNIRPKADLSLLFDRFVCRQVTTDQEIESKPRIAESSRDWRHLGDIVQASL